MAIRGHNARKISSTQYAPNHIKSIIKSLGLDIAAEPGNEVMFYCPFHSNRHTASCCINKSTGVWLCFNPSCGESGTLVELVRRVLHKNDFEAIRFIAAQETEILNNFDELMAGIFEDKPDFEEFSNETLNKLHKDLLDSNEAKAYFKSRGIELDSINYFELGYSKNMNMVTVPVHSPDGTPIGIVGRSIQGKTFKNSTNLPKSKTLFNVHRAKKIGNHVIIVESSFDAIRVHQAGFPNVVATLGGFLSTEQHGILNRYFNKITIMTDADLAGRELGLSVANRLKNKDLLWASYEYGKIYPHDAKDAGDMTDEEIKACIMNSVSDIEYRSWIQ
ncbi:MAG: toprim domain-containing protein [Alphaproteobacteria bacterium]|jgi:DNA primase|nr:toprim domain-containing protein [Alphaproteobacteria bacterium]